MSSEPRAFVTVDRGTASVAVALVGRLDRRWRLLGASASPASVPPEAPIERIRRRLAEVDPGLVDVLGLADEGAAAELPRVACATATPPAMTVVAATNRALAPHVVAAESAGWRVRPTVLEAAPITAVATALADPRTSAILAGSGDPPGADERPLMAELAAQVAAAAERRPDVTFVVTGSLAAPGGRYEATLRAGRPGAVVIAPGPAAGTGEPLRRVLDGLRAGDDDGRRALMAAVSTLAEVLRRPLELVEIGQSCGMRAIADHAPGSSAMAEAAVVAEAALLPRGFTDAHLDAIGGWLTLPLDRLRLRDRLRELAVTPWGDVAGDGIELRLAAVRAALTRLGEATRSMDAGSAELVVASGGVFAVAPARSVALALADTIRRPGVRALAVDHARLLAPLGTIADPDERRQVFADLRDELLVPLGTVVMPAGLRHGHPAGRLILQRATSEAELELVPGAIERLELAPGELAVAELRLRDALQLGPRARRLAVETTGGLAGVLVDLRDVPLRLPDRPERRRDVLAGWQRHVGPGSER